MEKFDYDAQIKELTSNPTLIGEQWGKAIGVFKFVGFGSRVSPLSKFGIKGAGCPIMIKLSPFNAYINGAIDEEITMQIRADERIPRARSSIKVEHLPILKEWQERIDAMSKN